MAAALSARLLKPVEQSDLLGVVCTVPEPVPVPTVPAKGARRTGEDATRPLHVLVAEDNVTNQKLVEPPNSRTPGDDGRERAAGNDRAAREPFDVILMDVQMPEVSGLEATTAIREHERGTGRRTPILALTASAMAGDREECGGRHGRHLPNRSGPTSYSPQSMRCAAARTGPSAQAPHAASGSVNIDTLLVAWPASRRLVQEVVDVFMEDAPAMISRLRDAAAAADAAKLAAAAHALKAAAGLFAEGKACERAPARRLAKAGDLSAAGPALADVEADVSQLIAELRTIRDGLKSA